MSGLTSIVMVTATWACLALAAWSLFWTCINRLLMIALYGRSRYETCRCLTWFLGLQSQRILTLRVLKWLCALVGLYGIVRHFESDATPFQTVGDTIIPAILLLIACVQFYGQERPAAILLLGASDDRTLRMHARLRDAAWPHRVVSFLETNDRMKSQNWNAGDCFRISWGTWERVICRFIRCSILIIIDTRHMTPAVEYELREVIQQEVQFKTVLVSGAQHQAIDHPLGSCRHVDTEEACCKVVQQAFVESRRLPSDTNPIASM